MSGENWQHDVRKPVQKPQAAAPTAASIRLRSEAQHALDLNFEAFKQEVYRSLALVYRLR
jgi:hypothetical protein